LIPSLSNAGEYQAKLSNCLVNSADAADRRILVRWIFAAVASHPDVSDMTRLTPNLLASVSKDAGGVFQKLIAVKCANESREAIINEGATAFKGAFETLGSVAGQGLMSDPSVAKAMAELGKNIDETAIMKAMIPAKSNEK